MVTGIFRECSNSDCQFRFPDFNSSNDLAYCPKCGSIALISCRVNSDQSNLVISKSSVEIIPLLDNIRSVYNVGSIFRTCEGFGISEIILSGITPTPDHPRMGKTSLGAIPHIEWHYANNGLQKATDLKTMGFQIVSLESSRTAIPIMQISKNINEMHMCLVVGNENFGVDPDIQKMSDLIVAIPMSGEKESFNVSVAFGIAVYHFAMAARI
jgi:23S rRNA (guanosine2251-2'-O)-methyltransferase